MEARRATKKDERVMMEAGRAMTRVGMELRGSLQEKEPIPTS